MTTNDYDNEKAIRTVVVGCGVAGLAVSLGIVRKNPNCRVDIVEKKQDVDTPQGATFGLAPAGQVALQEIAPSVLEYLKSIGVHMPFSGGYMLPWWEVRRALLEEARKVDAITIHMGLDLEKLDESNEKQVELHFSNSDLVLNAHVVIGADGVYSKVRSLLGLDKAEGTGAWIWRGRVHVDPGDKVLSPLLSTLGISTMYPFGSSIAGIFNFHSKLPGTLAWFVSTKEGEDANAGKPARTPLDLLETYSKDNPDKTKDLDVILEVFKQSDPHDLEHKTALSIVPLVDKEERWGGRGRVTLIGDAAHAIRAASGLGGSLAMEDAAVLSEMLAYMAEAESVPAALEEFEVKRKPRCQIVQKDQTLRSEASYDSKNEVPPWTSEFVQWLNMGHRAPDWPLEKEIYETNEGDQHY